MREWAKTVLLVAYLGALATVFVSGAVCASEVAYEAKAERVVEKEPPPAEAEVDLLWWVRAGEAIKLPKIRVGPGLDLLWWIRR